MTGGRQPLHNRFDLVASPSAVRQGRVHAGELLARWGVARAVADDAVLVVSELLSNAVQHAATSSGHDDGTSGAVVCSLLLRLTEKRLTISVSDPDRRPPVPRDAAADAECGRGLHLVEALSEAWGYRHSAGLPGKYVWARLPLPRHGVGGGRVDAPACPVATGTGAVRTA